MLACIAFTSACDNKCKAKKAKRAEEKALTKACRELNGGTKIKLEIDLDGACRGKCKNRKKKAKKAGPKKVIPVKVQGKPKGGPKELPPNPANPANPAAAGGGK